MTFSCVLIISWCFSIDGVRVKGRASSKVFTFTSFVPKKKDVRTLVISYGSELGKDW